MTSAELREKFLKFFKDRGHAVVPSSSLLSDDPSVLLTTAGMQQFKPYFTGTKDPIADFGSKNTASIQKSFRTSDIDEVGDESHLTFFEMLGNFSFGGYFKKEAIEYAHEFVTRELGLNIAHVSIFAGDGDVPRDDESEKIWRALGVTDIKEFGREDNFWGPTGNEGPCGPTTEIYVANGAGTPIEIWNLVFNEYYASPNDPLRKLSTPGVDTGMGLERLSMVVQKTPTLFETDLFAELLDLLPAELDERKKRIVADHTRAIAFLAADGVRSSNKGAGYVLRRLLRRLFTFEYTEALPAEMLTRAVDWVVSTYGLFHSELGTRVIDIKKEIAAERERYLGTLAQGLKEIERLDSIDAGRAFGISSTLGIPFEVIKDAAGERARNLTREDFEKEFEKHQEISRAGVGAKFAGGLADHDLETIKHHTATHLLNAALRKVLGEHVWQKGSKVSRERTRFDFTHEEKMTDGQIAEVERLVNEWITKDLPVRRDEMSREEAEKLGAIGVFGEKYPERVSIYTIEDLKSGEVISREFCGGPHVSRTGELGRFHIIKEESSSAGVRRIKATLE